MLSDQDIEKELKKGKLRIESLADPNDHIQPASIDLRLGPEFLWWNRSGHRNSGRFSPERQAFILLPRMFVLASTLEKIVIPDYLAGRVEGKSSLGRSGLVIHATAGFIDPGFEGTITLEMFCVHPGGVILSPGMLIAQLALTRLESPAKRPYGHPSRASKYQGQDGPTEARK